VADDPSTLQLNSTGGAEIGPALVTPCRFGAIGVVEATHTQPDTQRCANAVVSSSPAQTSVYFESVHGPDGREDHTVKPDC
jgi:hypothetical protein